MTPFIILIALQVMDALTTIYALKNGLAQEGNRFLKVLIDRFGITTTLIAVKAAFLVVVIVFGPTAPVEVLYLLIAGMAFVVISNFRVIYNSKK